MKKGVIIIFKENKKKKRINVSKDEYTYLFKKKTFMSSILSVRKN